MNARLAWIVVPLVLPLAGCHRQEVAAKPPALVSAYTVAKQSGGEEMLRYSGSIKPHTQVNLAFKVSGYIRDILQRQGADGRIRLVQQGDRVARGTVLAQVQQADYTTRAAQADSQLQGSLSAVAQAGSQLQGSLSSVAQARSHLAQTIATREQARAGVRQAESNKESAESQLAAAQTSLSQAQAGLAQAQAGKREAQAALVQAEATRVKAALDFERATNLLATQSTTKEKYDAAKAQAEVSQAQVHRAQQQIEGLQAKEEEARSQINTAQARIAGATAQVKTSQAQIDEAKAQLQASEDIVRAARAQVKTAQAQASAARAQVTTAQAQASAARAQLASAQIPVRDTSLQAPLDAVVLQRNVEVGTFVAAGTVGFVLADTRSVKVVFGVSDVEMRHLRLGMLLSITTEAYPSREFQGKVTAISPSADTRSRVFDIEVTVPNPDGRLKSGMIISLELPAPEQSEAQLTVPVAAIVGSRGDGQDYAVFVVENQAGRQVARSRDVTLGPVLDNAVVIRHGLKAGERVVTTGGALLVDGEAIKVVE